MNGILVTTLGRKICLHRLFEAAPTYTAPVYFRIGKGNDTPAAGDTHMETPITEDWETKAIVAGYPSFDDTNLVVTVRGLVLTTEANVAGTISEFGLMNSDATKRLFSHAVFTAVTKNTSVQVIFVEKDRVV